MATETLRDLYHTELQDLYEAERQLMNALSRLAFLTTDSELRDAFERHVEQGRIHVERLELLFDEYDLPKTGGRVTAIDALIQDSDRRVQSMKDSYVRDAALIAAAQLVAHYQIAGYGCVRTYARQLGLDDAADLLQQTLHDERAFDEELTQIATIINGVATPTALTGDELRPARLRYVGAKNLDRAIREYADHKIQNAAGDEIGKVNGFIVDASRRPHYLVVDSGGLFVGRCYIMPIAKVTLNRSARTFTIDVNKETLKSYPEFHRDGFVAMTDEEVRLYEWRVLETVDPEFAREARRGGRHENPPLYRQPEWGGSELEVTADRAQPRDTTPDSAAAPTGEGPKRAESEPRSHARGPSASP